MISEAEREQAIALVKRLFAEAVQLQGAGREGEAIALYNRLLRIAPDQPPALHNLGVLYRNAKRYPAAVACYRRALLADPKAVSTLSSLGNAYKDWGKLDEALAVHRRAAQLAPEDVGVLHNLAITLRERDENAEALELLEKVVGLDPKRGEAVWDLALTRLHLGDYERGWDGYEARWALAEHKPPKVSIPPWDGGPRPGKTLLLTTEQGFGDAIQFARFIPAARALFGRVLLSCREPLHRLMAAAPGVDAVVPYSGRVPAADFHAHLLSLPRFLGHRFDHLPGAVGYLGAPDPNPAVATTLNAMRGFKVGIVWSGSVTFKGNDKRATSLERFLRFLEVPGVRLFSLQKGPPAQELLALKGEGLVIDLAPLLDDFADTAAAIKMLDLVIMTDSAVTHLCGALNRPVWSLLCAAPDWRWMSDRADSPWYPSVRLFRQKTPGDWDGVFEEAVEALYDLVTGGASA